MSMIAPQEQIQKARNRAAGWDIDETLAYVRDKTPDEIASASEKEARRRFLQDSLGDTRKAQQFFERIIQGNELQDANYLSRGTRAAKAVARIAIRESTGRLVGWGTGFLIAPGVLITNNHVLPERQWAVRSEAQFGYERDIDGRVQEAVVFQLRPESLYHTEKDLDFTIVAVAPQAENGGALDAHGWLSLLDAQGKAVEGEWLTIIQHPNGERKQLCVRENRLLKRAEDVLWYSTDTLGGSSGSPVFNNEWIVVALHHSGVPEERDGRIQTVDGRDWDPQSDGEEKIKWKANEGIRASRIVQTLKEKLSAHPLLQSLFGATPSTARVSADQPKTEADALAGSLPIPFVQQIHNHQAMSTSPKIITVQIQVEPSGDVRLLSGGQSVTESVAPFIERQAPAAPAEANFDAPFDDDYGKRKGYNAAFLGGGKHQVNLPKLSPALEKAAVELLKPAGANKHVLHYLNYSLVMHRKRRFAIYSAANVAGDQRFNLSRPADVWRTDPRIPLDVQVSNFYYKKNKFDRGHLTRREDLEYGASRVAALQSAADTCHYTNATPQHERFNQNKELWQGIERFVLEQAIETNNFNAQVITGPVLEEDDPVFAKFPDIQYPVRFWKVVAAVNASGKLFATAYILDQSDVIEQFGIEAVGEIPFGAYKTFQVKIAEVERLTQLKFTGGSPEKPLSGFDPLETGVPRRPRRPGSGFRESTAAGGELPAGYLPLTNVRDIYVG